MAAYSPPTSLSSLPTSPSTQASKGTQTPLSLDLSSVPPLITPSPPSNTLLITNLNAITTFHPATLEQIKDLLSQPIPLNSFSPLRSFHRIIVSYATTEAATDMRQVLDGFPIGEDEEVRIYFGEHTPIQGEEGEDQHLHPPSLGKLLFISPPPSPPCGWEIREEEPPNKDVHAEDLQKALAGLNGHRRRDSDMNEPMSEEEREGLERQGGWGRERKGTVGGGGSMMVYHPSVHGDREDLPAVMVVDTEGEGVEEDMPEGGGRMLTHTARPPVELMGDA